MQELTVIGAGVIGLSCAWRAAVAGWRVTVIDPAPASGASWVAGGMLAPVTEAWPGEERLLDLGVESLRRWPGFAADLGPCGLRTEGTVVAATGSGDRAELDAVAGHLSRLGRDVERLSGRELRRLEPAIGPDVRGGLSVPGDLAVDNRVLLAALRRAAEASGVRFVASAAQAVVDDGERVTGVVLGASRTDPSLAHVGTCADDDPVRGTVLPATFVLVAAGAHSGSLHPVLDGLVRPVKGEILRLGHRPGAFPPPRRTVRALVDGRAVYLVPRDDGGLVVGATQTETGFDTDVTVGGVRDLLRDAERVLPGIAEYALRETAAGLRPGSPDNRPLIGALGPTGLLVATGHGRNGMLLAPLTADAVLGLLRGEPGPADADPTRFQEVAA
ncbi:FAD-dependent oxidoreductase [Pseudonocardia abyssalis]|uniref:FAD-dependent oxidoreductase n=1 Tax=Pseudonocardia abyssalis TaxID=2792008 RepID=A0ABS6UZZ6_9PSEU|nr:FAD-dependent oxidoreductase [Pseudonocardia abyssalis]MBW0118056.1 FAD-dependent oxidoreductase [Pseudonocardia abyssalis]MBW0137732.1 FAD-dependent oxidoreductase [Pseudonocardia abyssalis]